MRIGEPEPLLREAVHVRRLQRPRTVGRHVAVAEIVGVDEDDVRARLRECRGRTAQDGEEETQESTHAKGRILTRAAAMEAAGIERKSRQ